MRRLIKVVGLIYLGVQLEHRSRKLLVKHGMVRVDQYGTFRKTKDWDDKINKIVGRIVPKKSDDGTY